MGCNNSNSLEKVEVTYEMTLGLTQRSLSDELTISKTEFTICDTDPETLTNDVARGKQTRML